MTKEESPVILTEGLTVRTDGLVAIGQPELKARVDKPELLSTCRNLITFLSDYVINVSARIQPEHKVAYGYWVMKFVANSDELEAWELEPKGEHFVPGVNLTLKYWIDQHEICQKVLCEFAPPRPEQLVVVSEGVFEGDRVKAVRYPSPEHMSGWWMITDRYNGNTDSLRTEHLFHLTARRPDLSKYISLPVGYRFDLTAKEDIWFEEAILSEKV